MSNQKINWIPTVLREESVLFGIFIIEGIRKKHFEPIIELSFGFRNRAYTKHQVFMDRDELAVLQKLMEEKPIAWLELFAAKCERSCDIFLAEAKYLGRKYTYKASNYNLLEDFVKYCDLAINHAPYLLATIPIERMLSDKVSNVLLYFEKNNPDIKEKYSLFFSPDDDNFIIKELRSVLYIASQVQKSDELLYIFQQEPDEVIDNLRTSYLLLFNLIEEHIREFGWLNRSFYLRSTWVFPDIIDRINQWVASDSDLGEQYVQWSNRSIQKNSEFNAIIKNNSFSHEETTVLKLLRRYLFLRTHRVDCFGLADHYARPLLEEVAQTIGLTVEELYWMSHSEIIACMTNKESLVGNHFYNRRDNHLQLMIDDIVSIEQECPVVLPFPENNAPTFNSDGLPGVMAFPGVVRGVARIVKNEKDANKVERGDILVATMTTPDLIGAMERAVGFVTDEGGICSHASLISRELGVPCLIATKYATSIVPDGMLIEINTFDGIVRPL